MTPAQPVDTGIDNSCTLPSLQAPVSLETQRRPQPITKLSVSRLANERVSAPVQACHVLVVRVSREARNSQSQSCRCRDQPMSARNASIGVETARLNSRPSAQPTTQRFLGFIIQRVLLSTLNLISDIFPIS